MRKEVRLTTLALFMSVVITQLGVAQNTLPYKNMDAFVAYVNSHIRAPFERDSARLPAGGFAAIMKNAASAKASAAATLKAASTAGTHNVRVNQDHNPWPKAEIGSAVDPVTGSNYVVMSNDFREDWDFMFYHTSTNGGASFADDAMVGGFDPVTGGIPMTFQSDPGVAFDSVGHSILSTITGGSIFDFNNGYINEDTEIEVAEGFANGSYSSSLPIVVDYQPCNGTFTVFNCAIQLDKPLITVDNVAGSPRKGTIYVYYTVFCVQPTPCQDGAAGER